MSSLGLSPGPTWKTWTQTVLATIRPASVSPATVWSFSVRGMESSATVAVPPRPATRRGGTVVLEEDRAEPSGRAGDPHAANRTPATTESANGARQNDMADGVRKCGSRCGGGAEATPTSRRITAGAEPG